MKDSLVFEFPLSNSTRVYIDIEGTVPTRSELRAMIVLLEAHFALLEDPMPVVQEPVLSPNARRGRLVSAETQTTMIRKFHEGKSLSQIARETQTSIQSVSKFLRRLGTLPPPVARFKRLNHKKETA